MMMGRCCLSDVLAHDALYFFNGIEEVVAHDRPARSD